MIEFTAEPHKDYIVIFRINNGSTFITYDNAKDHPILPYKVYLEGKDIYEGELNKPF